MDLSIDKAAIKFLQENQSTVEIKNEVLSIHKGDDQDGQSSNR